MSETSAQDKRVRLGHNGRHAVSCHEVTVPHGLPRVSRAARSGQGGRAVRA
jgi:hypothetical protein